MTHHPYAVEARKNTESRISKYATGGEVTPAGAVHKHERHMHKGEKETKIGGEKAAKKRLDRPKRGMGGMLGATGPGMVKPMMVKRGGRTAHAHGGKAGKKHGTQVNVIVAGHGNAPPPAAPAMPPRPMPPVAGMAPGAGPPPMAPGAVPPAAMAGMMPRKHGGRTSRAKGGGVFTAGAGSGEGREQKAAKAKK